MADTKWLIKQWESLSTHQNEILRCLIADTIEALKRLEVLESQRRSKKWLKKEQ